MAEPNLGTKFNCYNCGTKFYDLGKSEPLCPKCGANQKDSKGAEAPAASTAARRKRKAEIIKPVDAEDEVPIEDLPEDEIAEPEAIEGEAEEEEVEELDDDEA